MTMRVLFAVAGLAFAALTNEAAERKDAAIGGCSGSGGADVVVLGKIFTSEGNKVVEAFAVKDGKYVYVGDKQGAEPDGKAKEWPLYDLHDKKVMVLDEFNIHPARESEHKITDWDRTYFLTNYYAF